MSLLTLETGQGVAKDYLLQRKDASGMAYSVTSNPSPYLATDTLAASLWPGGELTPVAVPAVAWVDASGAATYRMSLAAADTATLEGIYYWRVLVTRGAKTGELGAGRLRVAVSPGSMVVPPAFTTRDDLLRYAPWLEDLQTEADEQGFAIQQARATTRLTDYLVNLWRPSQMTPTLGQPGFMPTNMSYGSSAPQSWWLREQIVPLTPNSGPNALYPDRMSYLPNMIDPRVSTALLLYDEVKEVCARWAIAFVCDAQIGRAGDRTYWEMGERFKALGDQVFRTTKFQIDLSTPQTGWAAYTVHGGGGSVR